MQDHHNPLSQHGVACYVTKFESKSFRLRSNFRVALCSARKLLAQSAVRSKSRGKEKPNSGIFFEQVSRLLCCAYASYSTENKGLLTEQVLPLSKESLFRQQAFGSSCANALVLCLLLHRQKWILQVKAGYVYRRPRVSQAIVVYVFRVPHSCKVGAFLSALFHCHRPVACTDATHALPALSAPLKPYTERCAG